MMIQLYVSKSVNKGEEYLIVQRLIIFCENSLSIHN